MGARMRRIWPVEKLRGCEILAGGVARMGRLGRLDLAKGEPPPPGMVFMLGDASARCQRQLAMETADTRG